MPLWVCPEIFHCLGLSWAVDSWSRAKEVEGLARLRSVVASMYITVHGGGELHHHQATKLYFVGSRAASLPYTKVTKPSSAMDAGARKPWQPDFEDNSPWR